MKTGHIVVAAGVVVGLLAAGGALAWRWANQGPVAVAHRVDGDAAPPARKRKRGRSPLSSGRYRRVHQDAETVAQLEAIGYLPATQAAGPQQGVTTHDRARAWQGLNLYNSGHHAGAILVDMDGEVLHTWERPVAELFPTADEPRSGDPESDDPSTDNPNTRFWRRVHLLENGHLLVIVEGIGLARLDREARVLWALPNHAHHDLAQGPDGRIHVLTRKVSKRGRKRFLEDALTVLDGAGTVLKTVSLIDAYRRSAFADHLDRQGSPRADPLHTNTVTLLGDDAPPPFRSGQVLLSMRHLNTLAVLDPDEGRIVWSARGDWRSQHDPQLVEGGELLFFDNGSKRARASRVVQLDPTTLTPSWVWSGPPEAPLWSASCGTVQRLPNGNTLVAESDRGRALEVTRDGDVVWAWHSPHRPADQPDLVATLFDLMRLPPDAAAGWALPSPGTAAGP